MIGEDAVFQRSEQAGLHAERDQHHQQDRHTAEYEAKCGSAHQGEFRTFQDADQSRLVAAVGELSGARGQQHVGQDEQARGKRDQYWPGGPSAVQRQHHQRVAHQVVVQSRAGLRGAERPEPAGAE